MDCAIDDREALRDEEPRADEDKPKPERSRKRRVRQRKNRKPSRPANYIGQRSNRRLKKL